MKKGSTVLEVCHCLDYAWPHVHLDQPVKPKTKPKRAKRAPKLKAEKVTRGDIEWLTAMDPRGRPLDEGGCQAMKPKLAPFRSASPPLYDSARSRILAALKVNNIDAGIRKILALESVARAAWRVSGDAETTGDLLVIEHMCALDRALNRLDLASRRKS